MSDKTSYSTTVDCHSRQLVLACCDYAARLSDIGVHAALPLPAMCCRCLSARLEQLYMTTTGEMMDVACDAVMYFTPSILELAGFHNKRTALLVAMLPAAVNAAGSIAGAYLIDRTGRRSSPHAEPLSHVLQHRRSNATARSAALGADPLDSRAQPPQCIMLCMACMHSLLGRHDYDLDLIARHSLMMCVARRKLLLSSIGGVALALCMLGGAFRLAESAAPAVRQSTCPVQQVADCNACLHAVHSRSEMLIHMCTCNPISAYLPSPAELQAHAASWVSVSLSSSSVCRVAFIQSR